MVYNFNVTLENRYSPTSRTVASDPFKLLKHNNVNIFAVTFRRNSQLHPFVISQKMSDCGWYVGPPEKLHKCYPFRLQVAFSGDTCFFFSFIGIRINI